MRKKIGLIGLGVVGAPLAFNLWKKYGDDFLLLSSAEFLPTLRNLHINGENFTPRVASCAEEIDGYLNVLFVCVKNYHVNGMIDFLKPIIDERTIIVPLQNGIYSCDLFSEKFPDNLVVEGFAKGPNTQVHKNVYVYQKPGVFHIGTSYVNKREKCLEIYNLMKAASVDVYYDDNIKYEVWKKFMLNTAGNAITALTGIDYCMFSNSDEVQDLCVRTMKEFCKVAKTRGIELNDEDIEDVMKYYKSFTVSKHTSMLEDVLNNRPTENEYIAGYICKLADELGIEVPNIKMLYELIKIKEQVYMGML